MTGENFRIPSTRGDAELSCWRWMPNNRPRAVLQISHGMIEHITRYSDFAEFLASNMIAVYGHDHLGHGDTSPDDLGFFAEKNGDEIVVDDVFEVTKRIEDDLPGIPVFLLGHSMGSFIARRYVTRYGNHLKGAIFVGTGQQNPIVLGMGLSMAKSQVKRKGPRFVSDKLNDMALGNNDKKFTEPDMKKRWISRDPETIRKYNADPFCTFRFTSSGFVDLFTMIRKLEDRQDFGEIPKDLPMIFMSGAQDPIGENGKAVARARNDMLEFGLAPDIKLYDGARHEILNETNRREVYTDILRWIENLIKR